MNIWTLIISTLGDILAPDAATLMVFNVIFLALTVAGAGLAWAFAAVYWAFYPWQRNRSGRAVMFLVVSLAAVLSLVVLARAFHEYPGRVVLTLIVYAAIPAALTSLLFALLSKWRHASDVEPSSRSQRVAADFDRTIPPKRKAGK